MADLKRAIDAVEYGIRAAESAGGGEKLGRSSIVMMKTSDLDNILELLKTQEPVEPIEMINDFYPIGDPLRTEGWKCGKCGQEIAWDDNYCSKCGTAVKWVE